MPRQLYESIDSVRFDGPKEGHTLMGCMRSFETVTLEKSKLSISKSGSELVLPSSLTARAFDRRRCSLTAIAALFHRYKIVVPKSMPMMRLDAQNESSENLKALNEAKDHGVAIVKQGRISYSLGTVERLSLRKDFV